MATTGQIQVQTNSDTGVEVTNSQTVEVSYKFTPSGTWKPKADIPECTAAGLKGFSAEIQQPLSEALKPYQQNLKYPNNTTFALVAVNKKTGVVTEVGQETTIVLKAGETLVFLVNDFTPNYADNTGTLTVQWSATPIQVKPIPGKDYYLVAKHSGKVLDVKEASKENSANVMQYEKKGGDNQKWQFQDAGDGYYNIVAKHSGKLLNVAGGSKDNNTNVIQYQKAVADNEKWQLQDAGDGYYYIVAKHSSKVLDVAGGSKDNSANVAQYEKNGGDHQKWKYEAV